MATSMFSKRHYEAVAEVLRETDRFTYTDLETVDLVKRLLADLFEADNPLDGKGRGFKRDKWEEACER